MKLRVLLVEDDHIQRADLQQEIESRAEAVVKTKTCEYEFQRDFETIASDPPDVAVIDVMLRWASPSPDMPIPLEIRDPVQAGLRCAERLTADPRTEGVKLILYSVLPKESLGGASLPGNATYLVKGLDCQDLIDELTKIDK